MQLQAIDKMSQQKEPQIHVGAMITKFISALGKHAVETTDDPKVTTEFSEESEDPLPVGHGAVKHQLPHGNGSQLALAESSKHQCLVDQGPFLPEPFQPALYFRAQLAVDFTLPLAPVNRHTIQQRPATRHVQELRQFGFGQRPTGSATVGVCIGLRHSGKRIAQQPWRLGCHAPIAEGQPCASILVVGRGAHAFGLAVKKPAFQGGGVQVGKPKKAALTGNPPQLRAGTFRVCGHHRHDTAEGTALDDFSGILCFRFTRPFLTRHATTPTTSMV